MERPPPWLEPRTAYIHIPFCRHHCGYCDFAVAVGQDSRIPLYLEALAIEMDSLREPRLIDSLFIGGGTPTYLPVPQLEQLLRLMKRWFIWNPESHHREYSIESTPDSLDDERCQLMAQYGINRVSIGVQSFQPELLQSLDRRHSLDEIEPAIQSVQKYIRGFSLDLIFAAPGSTLATWKQDLAAAIAYRPPHISTYGLTYEEGTPLTKKRSLGRIQSVTEDDELAMYEMSIDTLASHGYEHYEISNFAQSGHRCRHNERYWANEAYYGFGVGAARYVEAVRSTNTRRTDDYIRRVLAEGSAVDQSEQLSDHDRAMETMAVQLRRCDGIEHHSFQVQTGYALYDLVGKSLDRMIELQLLMRDDRSTRFTRTGKFVADRVIEELMTSR